MLRTEDREKLQGRVLDLLKGLRGEHQLKELCRELNYEHRNTPLSSRRWRSAATQRLVDEKQVAGPVLLASAGSHDEFKVIYTRLLSSDLRLGYERQVVSELLQDHPYALFIFSNDQQDRWHFLNVKYYREQGHHSRIFRRIAIGGHNRLHTAAKRLSMLDFETMDSAAPLDIQNTHDEAFNVEAVTLDFFQSYKQIFDDLQKELLRQTRNKDRRWAHDYVLQFLNRIMFLYFIQRKTWLGDETEFLRTFWQSYDPQQNKDSFFDRWLKILFFESFNRPFQNRNGMLAHLPPKIRDAVKHAPYLNGGLFKPNELDDTSQHQFLVTDKMFEQVFNFLEKHNFTIAEDSPLDQEVAVDPEMIGRVYESLVNVSVEAEEQGDAGIFYTPRSEIDLMCRLALVDNLANHLGHQHKSLLYETIFAVEEDEKGAADQKLASAHLWPEFAAHLRQLTALDPACGSGSFLVGMLHILNDLQGRANNQLRLDESEFDRKKRIIAENLYGVEVMKWATHVTELRLWLALIVDAPFSLAQLQGRNEPLLPHFTFRIRQGDSLVQDVGEVNLGHKRAAYEISKEIRTQIDNLKEEKLEFYHSEPRGRFASEKEAKKFERQLFLSILEKRREAVQSEIKRLQHKIAGPPAQQLRLDGRVEPRSYQMNLQAMEWQKQVEALKDELDKFAREQAALKNSETDFFVWDIAFVEVLASERQGFDIVIGNPPYVRQESICSPTLARDAVTKENKQAYKVKLANSVYQAFPQFFGYKRAIGHVARKLDGKSDLYIYFYFHALSLLNPHGSFCFITSNSWLDVGYGAELQEFLLKHCHVKMIIDNQVQRSFGQADVNTVIALFSAADESREWGLEEIARFVMFKQPFENILSAPVFEEIEAAEGRQATPLYKIHPQSQRELLAAGCEAAGPDAELNEPLKKGSKPKSGPLIKIERYLGDKWGGKYLRAPDIYWTILKKGKDKLVRLGNIAEVRRGVTTGANKFFYLDDALIRQWRIEREFLKPVIKSPRECKRILIDPKDLKYKIFMCHKEKKDLKGTNALEYIKWGESQAFNERPTCAGRIRWWDVGDWEIKTFAFPCGIREHFKVLENSQVFIDKRLYEINVPIEKRELFGGLLNSSLFAFSIETESRNYGGGGGPIDATVDEVQDYHILNISKIANSEVRNLNLFYSKLRTREIKSIFQEHGLDRKRPSQHQKPAPLPDRLVLDEIVFGILGLTRGECDAVYEAVINLVESRLKKAESLNPKHRHESDENEEMETADAELRRPTRKAEIISNRGKAA